MVRRSGGLKILFITGVVITATIITSGLVAAAQEQEPNDNITSAQQISEGELTGEITQGESDFFKFNANNTDALNITVTPESAPVDLRLIGPDGQKIIDHGSIGAGGTGQIIKELPENGTYYVEIEGADEQASTPYTLTVSKITPAENDNFAPNDEFASAATVSEGFSNAKIWGGESDFFKITANDTDALDITVTPGSADVKLRLYAPDSTKIGEFDNFGSVGVGSTGRLTRALPENGTYYIEVEGVEEQATTAYRLNVNKITPAENDKFAPNDNFDSAATISDRLINAKVWGGESDFYRVGLNASEGLEVTTTPESGRVRLRLYSPDQQQIAAPSTGAEQTAKITYSASESGTYYVEVTGTVGAYEPFTTAYRLGSNRTGLLEAPAEQQPPVVDRYDSDGDGQIDDTELLDALTNYPENVAPSELLELLAAYNPRA